MPLGTEINGTDIDHIADVLGVSFADEDRRNALLSTETCDIQACPGSGKTTQTGQAWMAHVAVKRRTFRLSSSASETYTASAMSSVSVL